MVAIYGGETMKQEPEIRTSSRKGLNNTVLGTRNLMTVAALAVVGCVLIIPLSYAFAAGAVTISAAMFNQAFMGLWLVPYLLPAVVVKRPGASLLAGAIMGIISTFTTPIGASALMGNLIGAFFVELGLAILLYKVWDWRSFLFAGFIFGLLNNLMLLALLSNTLTFGSGALLMAIALSSALAGVGLTLLVVHLLHRAGVGIAQPTGK